MSKERLEAFSDGVIAILITIMVLELRPPADARLASLVSVLPVFASYVLSFVFLAIYWNNHHHLLQACDRVGGGVLWANTHLLFWLSLVPFVTAWMGRAFQPIPVACYGGVLLLAAVAYFVLTRALLAIHGPGSVLATAIRGGFKEKLSVVIYAAAIALAFLSPAASCALYVAVALWWLVPDRRIERRLTR